MNREATIERVRMLGGWCSRRQQSGTIFGVQLRNTEATDDDLLALTSLREEIEVIGIEGTKVTDKGVVHLLSFPLLHNIDATKLPLTDSALDIIAQIPSLEYLHIEGTLITQEAVDRFCRSHPQCEVVW